MSDDDDSDKQHEPSQKKLDDARKRGEIPRSTDVATASAYLGFVVTAMAVGGTALQSTGNVMYGVLENVDLLSDAWF
ncbi:MAG: EscU/YscU/HrcU family type III secretion system export apparatus switch protein, partial [Celeribacter marinus]